MADEDQVSIQFRKNIKEEFGKVTDTISSEVKGAASAISSGVSDVIGPEMSQLASSVSNLGKSMAASILGIFKRSDKESEGEKRTNSLLGGILDHFKKQEKMAAAEMGPGKKRSWLDKTLLIMVAAVGLAIGAVIRKFVLPFELLYKVLKPVFMFFGFLGKLAMKIPGIKFLVGKGGLGIANLIAKVQGVVKKVPLLGTLFTNVAKGFKVLGWPLTILMGLIDFVKGFMATEGDIVSKIKAGLLAAFTGFVEMPVKLIGWITDWILKAFGLEMEGGAGAAMMAKVTETFSWVFDKIAGLFSGIGDIVQWFMDKIEKMPSVKKLGTWISGGLKSIFGAKEVTPTGAVKTAATSQIDAIKSDRVTTAKTREEKRKEEQRKRDATLAKTGETMTTAVGDQTTVISSMVKKEPPIVEVPYHVDNYLLGTSVGGL